MAEPTKLGELIDMLYEKRAERIDLERSIDELKSKESELKQSIIDVLKASGMEGAKGLSATAAITYKTKPSVTDWDQVYAFVLEKKMPELFQKRITEGLWKELVADGIAVPGVEPTTLVDLSLTKSKR